MNFADCCTNERAISNLHELQKYSTQSSQIVRKRQRLLATFILITTTAITVRLAHLCSQPLCDIWRPPVGQCQGPSV